MLYNVYCDETCHLENDVINYIILGAVLFPQEKLKEIGPFVPGADDDMLICRCEEVTKGEIRKAIHEGIVTMEEMRRYLRNGMGLCQ